MRYELAVKPLKQQEHFQLLTIATLITSNIQVSIIKTSSSNKTKPDF